MTRLLTACFLTALLMFGLAGCGASEPPNTEQSTAVDASSDQGAQATSDLPASTDTPPTEPKPRSITPWLRLFDGESLSGWRGDERFWSVEDGVILGQTTPDNPTEGNTFLVYVGDNDSSDPTPPEFANFELKAEYRITGHNSGIQYRSFLLPDKKSPGGKNDGFRVGGYQADIDVSKEFVGMNYGEAFRGVLAPRGQSVTITGIEAVETPQGRKGVLVSESEPLTDENGNDADAEELATHVRDAPEWNEYHVVADGDTLTHTINGVLMSRVIDQDKKRRRATGLIALQLHAGPPMTIEFRNVRVKELP